MEFLKSWECELELLKLNKLYNSKIAKPFIKWAGGKTQLLPQIKGKYPLELNIGLIKNYYEPFLGGGAVFFDLVQNHSFDNTYLCDNNEEVIVVYKVLQKKVDELISFLYDYQKNYLVLDEKEREEYFYEIRTAYNLSRFNVNHRIYSENWIPRAAQMIFLNRTCFNGLYRLNKKGEFNVPFGRYANPKILNETNLLNVSQALQNAELLNTDFEELKTIIKKDSFVYFDPPYRPISKTASFNSFDKTEFGDKEQKRLAKTFMSLDKKESKLMLSNSDPKNVNSEDNFFDELYQKFNISRVPANRIINSVADKRGKINEILITNY